MSLLPDGDAGGRGSSATAGRESPAYLRKKMTVGSAGTSLSYHSDERVFHSKDMPDRARAARLTVKKELANALSQRNWNASVTADEYFDKRVMKNFEFDPTEYVYNFRAEKLPSSRPVKTDVFGRKTALIIDIKKEGHFRRTQEIPTSSEVRGPGFSAGGHVSDKEWRTGYERLRSRSLTSTKRTNQKILSMTGHKNPVQLEAEFMDDLRRTRSLLASNRHEGSSTEVEKPSDIMLFATGATSASHALTDPMADLDIGVQMGRPQKTKNVSKLIKRYHHEGAYGPVPADPDTYAWSCCGACSETSQGCVSAVVNPDKPCLLGF